MFLSAISSKEECGYIPLVTSKAFMNLSRLYIEYAIVFKDFLVALVNDFPNTGKKFQLRCKHNIVFVIVATDSFK